MDLKEIRKIVELMNEHGLSYFHLEEEGVNVKLKKGLDAEAIQAALGGMQMNALGNRTLPPPLACGTLPSQRKAPPPIACGE